MTKRVSREIEAQALRMFADAMVLKTLCGPTGLNGLDDVKKQFETRKNHFSFMKGYQLIVATCLMELLDTIVAHPSILGLPRDSRFQEWWYFHRNRHGLTSGAPFTQPDSDFANVVMSMQRVLNGLRTTNSWEGTAKVVNEAKHFSDALCRAGRRCTPSPVGDKKETPETADIIRRAAIERLSDYWEDHDIGTTYQFLLSNRGDPTPEDSWLVDDDPFWGIETHIDQPQPLFPTKKRIDLGIGIIAAMSVSFSQLTNGQDAADGAVTVFGRFSGSLKSLREQLQNEIGGEFPSLEFGLILPAETEGVKLIGPSDPLPPIPSEERLKALVGDELRTVVSTGALGTADFPMFIRGLASDLQQEEKIETLRIRHAEDDDDYLTWYSLAIRRPGFSQFKDLYNHSKWWLFYKAYGEGFDADPEVVEAERCVNETLQEFDDYINMIPFEKVRKSTLLDLFEPPAWRFVLNQAGAVHRANEDLRGALPELLASTLLGYWNYSNIRTSWKPSWAKVGELDAVGIQSTPEGDICVVIEAKGQAKTGQQLRDLIGEFGDKLRKLQESPTNLAKELGYDGTLRDIQGIFISMAKLEGFEHQESMVTLQDIDWFVDELDKAGVPYRLRKLLQTSTVPLTITDHQEPWRDYVDRKEQG